MCKGRYQSCWRRTRGHGDGGVAELVAEVGDEINETADASYSVLLLRINAYFSTT